MALAKKFPLLLGAAALALSGCTVGPNYKRPTAPVAAKWDVQEPWRESTPQDALAKGQWWDVFHDDDLNALEKQAIDANQTIKISTARLEQARAAASVQIATQFPTLGTAPAVERQRLSGNRPAASTFPITGPFNQNSYSLPFTVNYEVDLFGRRRRSIEAARASYQAGGADLENVRLVIAAEPLDHAERVRRALQELGQHQLVEPQPRAPGRLHAQVAQLGAGLVARD